MYYSKIIELIELKSEGDYWDFKSKHHEDKIDLLFDIICLANSPSSKDKYIIFGIDTLTYDVIGISNRPRNQSDIIDFLHAANFAENVAPEIQLETLTISNVSIDVLIIKNSKKKPYYLVKNYTFGKSTITRGTIFSREKDRNTAIDSIAPPHVIEKLWKERFGLLDKPIERFVSILPNAENWEWDGIDSAYYNSEPDYAIKIEDNDNLGASQYWWGTSFHEKPTVHEYVLYYRNTPLKKIDFVHFKNENIQIPFPEVRSIQGIDTKDYYDIFYYIENTIEYSLLQHEFSTYKIDIKVPIESFTKPPIMSLPFLILKNKEELNLLIQWIKQSWSSITWEDNTKIPIKERNKKFGWWVFENYTSQSL